MSRRRFCRGSQEDIRRGEELDKAFKGTLSQNVPKTANVRCGTILFDNDYFYKVVKITPKRVKAQQLITRLWRGDEYLAEKPVDECDPLSTPKNFRLDVNDRNRQAITTIKDHKSVLIWNGSIKWTRIDS